MGTSAKRISIVIPTRDHREMLLRLLNSITRQTFSTELIEVIVVDDGSSDGTLDFLRTVHVPFDLQIVHNENQGPPAARNAGLAIAHAPIVAFMDDDVVLRADCLERASAYFSDERVGIVETTLLIEGNERALQLYAHTQGFVTAAIFFRREALERVGGFDTAFFDPKTGLFFRDDADLGFRVLTLGYTAIQPTDVVAWHPVQFPSVRKSFLHVQRYMFDPLLYRKHPRLYRQYIERKKVGKFVFARPMHYASIGFVLALLVMVVAWMAGEILLAAVCGGFALVSHLIVRFKFQEWDAFKLWRPHNTVAYSLLPFWYLAWFLRGVRRYGGWKSLL